MRGRSYLLSQTGPGAVTQVSPKRTSRLPDFSGFDTFHQMPERFLFIQMFRLLTEFRLFLRDWFSERPSGKKASQNAG
jgi:hypothetical protein